MGMMAKMRSLAPWFIITVGGLFVLFMVLSDSKVADLVGRQNNFIGTIDGIDISYQDFSQQVESYRERLTQQQGADLYADRLPLLRDQVWDQMVSQRLVDKKIKEYGIAVSDEEIRDIILGDNPPEFLKRGFIDSLGNFNRENYENALFNPGNRDYLVQIEFSLKQQKLVEKLQEYLTASIIVTDEEVKEDFLRTHTNMSADFIKVNANSIPDSSIKVPDSELTAFYNKNKEDYKVAAARKVKYVFFRKDPTSADSSAIRENLVAIKAKLDKEPGEFKTYVDIYSDSPYKIDTLEITDLQGAADLLNNAAADEIVGPVLTREGYVLYKMVEKIRGAELQVKASHILIKGSDDQAKTKADEIYKELKNGADFAQTAIAKSEDGSASRGGLLGWFKQGVMVDDFWNAAKNTRAGSYTRPVKTQFGYHIIKVEDKTNDRFVLEKIANRIEVSPSTVDRLYERANDFAYLAQKNDFESEAQILGYNVQESMEFREDARVIPGLGYNSALVVFAFENSIGSVSDVFNFPTGYCVVTVSEEKPEGYKNLEDVKGQVKSRLIKEKKIEKAVEFAQAIYGEVAPTGNFDFAKNMYANAVVSKGLTFDGSGTISGLGTDYAVTEKALEAEIGKVEGPVKGNQGAYILKVLSRTPFNETQFAVQKAAIKDRLLNEKKNSFFNEWLVLAKDDIDVTDNRHKFFK